MQSLGLSADEANCSAILASCVRGISWKTACSLGTLSARFVSWIENAHPKIQTYTVHAHHIATGLQNPTKLNADLPSTYTYTYIHFPYVCMGRTLAYIHVNTRAYRRKCKHNAHIQTYKHVHLHTYLHILRPASMPFYVNIHAFLCKYVFELILI